MIKVEDELEFGNSFECLMKQCLYLEKIFLFFNWLYLSNRDLCNLWGMIRKYQDWILNIFSFWNFNENAYLTD